MGSGCIGSARLSKRASASSAPWPIPTATTSRSSSGALPPKPTRLEGASTVLVFDPAGHPPAKCPGMLSSLIVPRPIAMIPTESEDGTVNVAPYSYFMPVTGSPPPLAVTLGGDRKRVVKGQRVSVRVELGGHQRIYKKT